jgi:uncharacterized protein YecE (DUF72 family)
MAKLYLGLSGYAYKPWQGEGRFYPPNLKPKDFFDFYAQRFNAVEMDGTWYRMPTENAVQGWIDQAPPGFHYTFKVHRTVTHLKRLTGDAVESLQFMIQRLKPAWEIGQVGCVYLQFPPNFARVDDRLEKFLPHLPLGPRYAAEFRHPSWDTDEVEAILRAHRVGFAVSDDEGREGVRRDTGDLVYARLRKEQYTDAELDSWAAWFTACLEKDKDVYVFFKHEDEGSPWLEADRFRARMPR